VRFGGGLDRRVDRERDVFARLQAAVEAELEALEAVVPGGLQGAGEADERTRQARLWVPARVRPALRRGRRRRA
jgi:hypothetical protein